MYSKEDGMIATGIPDRVRHALDMRDLKNAVKAQNEAMDNLRNIIMERTEGGMVVSLEKKMTDRLDAQSEKFEVMLSGIGSQIERLNNTSSSITCSSSLREVLSVPMTVPASLVAMSTIAPLNAMSTSLASWGDSVIISSIPIVQANVLNAVELSLALKTEISAWKATTSPSLLHHWNGQLHYNEAPLDITGCKFIQIYAYGHEYIYIYVYM
jgi:hypothetical protein